MSRIFIALVIAAQLLLSAGSMAAGTMAASRTADGAVYWIDVRTPEEYQQGHVADEINIEYQDIAAGVKALGAQPGDTIYLHCRSGRRSGIALDTLKSLGYTHAVNLGGYGDAEKFRASYSQPAR